ncbi:MAG: hypothetical protein ACI4KM_11355 [Oscillospiraceae bacterium]
MEKKNSRLAMWALIPAFVLCFAVRLVQILAGTDMNTGFMYDDCGFLLKYGYYGLIILTAAALVALVILDIKRGSSLEAADSEKFVDGRAVMAAFPMLIMGALTIYEGVIEMRAITPSALLIFTDFVLGGLVTLTAFITLYKKEIKRLLGFSYAAGALLFLMRLMCYFMDQMAVASIPERLINCLAPAFATVFFMQLARLLCGAKQKKTTGSLVVLGGTGAVLILSSALATITAGLVAPEEIASRITNDSYKAELFKQVAFGKNYYMMQWMSWVDVLFAVMALLVIVVLYLRPAKQEISDDEQEFEVEIDDLDEN